MRVETKTWAVALALTASLSMTGMAVAQGALGGTGSGANVTGDGTVLSPNAQVGSGPASGARLRPDANDNPAGVIDGTNPNPNPGRAGGIASPERAGSLPGSAVVR